MTPRQIEIFHAVYTTGSVSKAAELLNISQPSVSKVLRHTEDNLDFMLFERTGGKLVPTNEAKDLSKFASRVRGEIDRLNSRIRQLEEDRTESLRVVMTPGIGLFAGPRALALFQKAYPKIATDIETLHFDDAVYALREGRADLAIVYQPFPLPGINKVSLAEGEFVCVSSRTNAFDKPVIPFSALNGEKVIMLNSADPLGKLLASHLAKKAPKTIEVTTVNTYHIAKSLAAEGIGHAIVDNITAKSPPKGRIATSKFRSPVTFSVDAIYPESKLLSHPEQQFLQCLKDTFVSLLDD